MLEDQNTSGTALSSINPKLSSSWGFFSIYIGASVGPLATESDAGVAFMIQNLEKHNMPTTVIGLYIDINAYSS
jgi:hypothetical protein